MFYNSNEFIGFTALEISIENNIINPKLFIDKTKKDAYVEVLNEEYCFSVISDCKIYCPNFEILGLVYSEEGYPTLYPVGINEGEEYIKYFSCGETNEFKLVNSFASLEEGRKVLENYNIKKEEIKKEVIIYNWDNIRYWSFNQYRYESVYELGINDESDFLYYFDSSITVPLLDKDMNENQYILYLLYYHNQLIAEIILKETINNESKKSILKPVYQRVASKDPATNKYGELLTNKYVEVLKEAKNLSDDFIIEGVIYSDDNLYPTGKLNSSGKSIYYDSKQSTIIELD